MIERHAVRRETGAKVELAESHQAGRNGPCGRFQRTQQAVGPGAQSAAQRCLLGRCD